MQMRTKENKKHTYLMEKRCERLVLKKINTNYLYITMTTTTND